MPPRSLLAALRSWPALPPSAPQRRPARTGATVVFASHDLNWVAAYSDRVIVLRDGVLAADAKPAELMQPELIESLLGFETSAVSVGGKTWLVPKM